MIRDDDRDAEAVGDAREGARERGGGGDRLKKLLTDHALRLQVGLHRGRPWKWVERMDGLCDAIGNAERGDRELQSLRRLVQRDAMPRPQDANALADTMANGYRVYVAKI